MTLPFQSVLDRLTNIAWETRLGISTRGKGTAESSDVEHIYYGTIHYPGIGAVLQRLDLKEGDVFVDLGCGKGRVVCYAARHAIKEVIGIEISGELATAAEKNSMLMRGRKSPIRIVHAPVEEFDYAQGTVFYMFHPFGPLTLERVVEKLRVIYEREHRPMRFAYVWPMHDWVLRKQTWLQEFERWETGGRNAHGHLVSFWKTTV